MVYQPPGVRYKLAYKEIREELAKGERPPWAEPVAEPRYDERVYRVGAQEERQAYDHDAARGGGRSRDAHDWYSS